MRKGLSLVVSLLMIVALAMASCATSPEPAEPTKPPDEPAKSLPEPTKQPTKSEGWPKFTYEIVRSYERSSLEEASKLVGWDVPVPVPTYLPKGCEIREVIAEPRSGSGARVFIVISDEEIEWRGKEFGAVMVIQVAYCSVGFPGLKLPGGNPADRGDHYTLWWQWSSGLHEPLTHELALSASKDIPQEELFKVRDGMQY